MVLHEAFQVWVSKVNHRQRELPCSHTRHSCSGTCVRTVSSYIFTIVWLCALFLDRGLIVTLIMRGGSHDHGQRACRESFFAQVEHGHVTGSTNLTRDPFFVPQLKDQLERPYLYREFQVRSVASDVWSRDNTTDGLLSGCLVAAGRPHPGADCLDWIRGDETSGVPDAPSDHASECAPNLRIVTGRQGIDRYELISTSGQGLQCYKYVGGNHGITGPGLGFGPSCCYNSQTGYEHSSILQFSRWAGDPTVVTKWPDTPI